MTGNCRPEGEQLVASAEGEKEATPNPEPGKGGCHPARTLELSVGTGGKGGNTAVDLEKAVKFAQCERDSGVKDLPNPTSNGSLVEALRIQSATGSGTRSISGFQAAADRCNAVDAGERGLRVQ